MDFGPNLGSSGVVLGRRGHLLRCLGRVLGVSWKRLGSVLGASWLLGLPWHRFVSIFGTILGPCWDSFGFCSASIFVIFWRNLRCIYTVLYLITVRDNVCNDSTLYYYLWPCTPYHHFILEYLLYHEMFHSRPPLHAHPSFYTQDITDCACRPKNL